MTRRAAGPDPGGGTASGAAARGARAVDRREAGAPA
jgi:hypothetical protein